MERHEIKSKKLSVTIPKVNLPSFMVQTESSITGDIAQRDVEIATLCGMSAVDIFAHYFFSILVPMLMATFMLVRLFSVPAVTALFRDPFWGGLSLVPLITVI